jgi:cellulose synthase/poly-beta-1,6-N-acetylglucosamine synthase-like glycosyltransferase
MIVAILSAMYLVCALLLAGYASGVLVLLLTYWRHRHYEPATPATADWPRVAVQLPVYNERHMIVDLLEAVAQLDYPRDRLMIQILDDSTDDTTALIIQEQAHLHDLDIRHVRRQGRSGYKAGALAAGLAQLDCAYVAVLDADFRPRPDFLKRTLPFLIADESLGMVQARWGHLNSFTNALTLGQTLALDGHFVVEQTARSRAGWLMNFSGSAGVWRVACIQSAGGWQATTLTEDLDLSYRAQLAGWRFLYLPDVEVPAELPPQMAAYKRQQARWAQGSTQTLMHVLYPLWQSSFTLDQRIMATLHLCQYLPHPLMLLLLLLTPPLMLAHSLHQLPLAPLGLLGIVPPLMILISQQRLYRDWRRRMWGLPVLVVLSTGLAWNNTLAVWRALTGRSFEFRRTPKFAHDWPASSYALRTEKAVWAESLLALYAVMGSFVAARIYPALTPYLALYGLAFSFVVGWTLRDSWIITRRRPA